MIKTLKKKTTTINCVSSSSSVMTRQVWRVADETSRDPCDKNPGSLMGGPTVSFGVKPRTKQCYGEARPAPNPGPMYPRKHYAHQWYLCKNLRSHKVTHG